MTDEIRLLMRWASLILTMPVVGYSAWPFFIGAWRDLKRRTLGMDVPVALGVGTAFVASVYGTFSGHGEVYYDSVTMFIFLLLTGRFLEMNARRRAGAAVEELVQAHPGRHHAPAQLAGARRGAGAGGAAGGGRPCAGAPRRDAARRRHGGRGRQRGERGDADRRIAAGVEERGCREWSAAASTRRARWWCGSTSSAPTRGCASIVRLLDRAQSEKPRIGQLADRAAAWFVGLAAADHRVPSASPGMWSTRAQVLWIVVSVLVVTCPCALGLATPAALTTATGRLTRLGLLTTRGHALETLARATDLVFDKTGTLTHGRLRVRRVVPLGGRSESEVSAHRRRARGGFRASHRARTARSPAVDGSSRRAPATSATRRGAASKARSTGEPIAWARRALPAAGRRHPNSRVRARRKRAKAGWRWPKKTS